MKTNATPTPLDKYTDGTNDRKAIASDTLPTTLFVDQAMAKTDRPYQKHALAGPYAASIA